MPGRDGGAADHQARHRALLRADRAVDVAVRCRVGRSTSTASPTASRAPRAASGTRPFPPTRRRTCGGGRTRSPRTARTRDYLLIDGAPALAWVANHAGFEIHPWTSTAATPEQPSYALIDIDPGTDDVVGGHAGDRPPVPRGDGPPRARRPPEGHRQAGLQIWIPVRRGLHLPRRRRRSSKRSRKTVGGVVPELVSWKWHKDRSRRQGPPRLHPERDQQDAGRAVQRAPGARRAGVGPAGVGRARRPRPPARPVDDPHACSNASRPSATRSRRCSPRQNSACPSSDSTHCPGTSTFEPVCNG